MSNLVFRVKSLAQLGEAAQWLLREAEGFQYLAFYGDLGAGKTTLIQELCRQSGVRQDVTSPTFALVNEYMTLEGEVIYHFDFYRMDAPEEVLDIGFEEYIATKNLCLMEWPDKIEPYLPMETLKVYIDVQKDDSRLIHLVNPSIA